MRDQPITYRDVAAHSKDGVPYFPHKLCADQTVCDCGAAVHGSTLRLFLGMIDDVEAYLAMTNETFMVWREVGGLWPRPGQMW